MIGRIYQLRRELYNDIKANRSQNLGIKKLERNNLELKKDNDILLEGSNNLQKNNNHLIERINDKDKLIYSLKEKEEELNGIKNSISWKVTKPLRTIRKVLK